MATEIAGLPPATTDCDLGWYVHKHRREHEAAFWDERRLGIQEGPEPRVVPYRLLVKFALCVVALTGVLGIVATTLR